ncbi:PIR Superfamily Protein [Plasmodium ovale wallikeri]|uniref:PIR Superfamily Protein n=1 Tax=Plasmodium ovale wallikeri TaxID=864142 RepID=A0A1A9AIN9_PLAOA|nr:PIR Superfamily Protein [Plasmodium ovale wallikeri]SBT55960.1 PIR Superfamily Protein [Plasmodium ovale wallikeri]
MELYATLEDLPSNIFYKKFDQEDSQTYYDACKAEPKINSDEKLVNLCAKIIKNFKLIEEIKENYKIKDKPCADLNYWVREELIKDYHITNDIVDTLQEFIYLYTALYQIQNKNEVGINDNCKIDYTLISMEELRNRKNLYDYLENYGELEKKYVQDKNECSKDHFDYINKSVALYKIFQEFCKPHSINQSKCPDFLKNIPVYYLNKDLSELTCTLKNETQETVSETAEVSIQAPSPSEKVPAQSIGEPDTDIPSQPGSSLSSTLMTTGVPVLGSFFVFSILYKLTPIGSLIRNRLLGIGESVNQVHDNAAHELWEDSIEPLDINSDRSGYQISYQTF